MTPKFIRLRGIGLFGMNGSVAGVVAFGCLFLSALGGARVVGNDGLMLLAAPIVTVMRRAVWIVTLMAAIMLAALDTLLAKSGITPSSWAFKGMFSKTDRLSSTCKKLWFPSVW